MQSMVMLEGSLTGMPQGELQGALSSLQTMCNVVAPLLWSGLYEWCAAARIISHLLRWLCDDEADDAASSSRECRHAAVLRCAALRCALWAALTRKCLNCVACVYTLHYMLRTCCRDVRRGKPGRMFYTGLALMQGLRLLMSTRITSTSTSSSSSGGAGGGQQQQRQKAEAKAV
jgi:hypothetical protein|eukprot:COSAG06_NODE_5351_length_3532_cov_2.775415_3_plen_174_part_00